MFEASWYSVAAIAGLALMTVLTRCFFFLSPRPLNLPRWVQRGLPFAPMAALSAVVIPEILLTRGEFGHPLTDARTWAALVGVVWYIFQRHSPHAVLGTIVAGMLVYLPLHVGLGW